MNWVYPDKPNQVSEQFVHSVIYPVRDSYAIQLKQDGWRLVTEIENGKHMARTRHKLDLNKAMKRERNFTDEVRADLHALNLPDIVLDGEYMSSRRAGQSERLYLFDVLFYKGKYLGKLPYRERFNRLTDLVGTSGTVRLIEFVDADFFDRDWNFEGAVEGIVLKDWNSKLIGSRTSSAKNPQWFKVVQQEFTAIGNYHQPELRVTETVAV